MRFLRGTSLGLQSVRHLEVLGIPNARLREVLGPEALTLLVDKPSTCVYSNKHDFLTSKPLVHRFPLQESRPLPEYIEEDLRPRSSSSGV